MKLIKGSGLSGAQALAGIAGAFALLASGALWAQSVKSVNGAAISTDVFNMYLQSRIQKPVAQATAEEREAIMGELTDIYLLTTQPQAETLAKNPQTAAQLELQERGILAQAVATDYMAKNPATEEEIKQAYQKQIEESPPLEFKARHILVDTQGQAVELIAELEGGADFAELAKEKSTGPSGPTGGDLGWFSPERMVPPFSKAVAELEDGAFSKQPVQTQFGWHVILREESRASTPPTLESVRSVVKQRIEADRLQEYLQELRATLPE